MNKAGEEQPENIEESQEPKTSETHRDAQKDFQQTEGKTQTKAEEQLEQKAEVKTDDANKARRENPKAKDAKGSSGAAGEEDPEASEFIEKVISINRITKVTKGGKKMSFSALVVVGDTKGNVGYSLSKAAEVATAIRKAMATAKKTMVKIPMHGTTIPHEIIGQCSGSRVLLKPASDGTGVIASGPVRAVCDGAGIHNILTKCHRSNNPINVVKATINGLTRLKPMTIKL